MRASPQIQAIAQSEYRERTILPQIADLSSTDRFAFGDLLYAARRGGPNEWQTYAALAFSGRSETALAGLSRFDCSEARFYMGAALWMSGDEDEALKVFKQCRTAHARTLIELIEKPLIKIHALLPHDWERSYLPNHRFKVTQPDLDEAGNIIGADGDADFYLSFPIEWHRQPQNLATLPFPTVGVVIDYDAHMQCVLPWLSQFDELVVNSSHQWAEVFQLTGQPPVSYFKAYGLIPSLPPINKRSRKHDLFMSGFIVHPFNPDKTLNFLQVLELEDINFQCHFGFSLEYLQALNDTKATWTYVRWPDGISTRGLESLAMGCALAVQEGSLLRLYVGEEEGVIPYRSSQELPAQLMHIIRNWDQFQERALRGSRIVRDEFSKPRIIDEFLRFATVLAAKPRDRKAKIKSSYLPYKDIMFFRGLVPQVEEREARAVRLLSTFLSDLNTATSPHRPLDTVNTIALEYTRSVYAPALRSGCKPTFNKKNLCVALELYSLINSRFANSLSSRFDMIRFALHVGSARDVSTVLKLAADILATPQEYWQLDPGEDLFPFDYFSFFFNYRLFTDVGMSQFMTRTSECSTLTRLVYASLHFYVGHYADELYHFRKAMELDDDMASYRLRYAQALLRRRTADDIKRAQTLLVTLARESVLFQQAYATLRAAAEDGITPPPEFEAIDTRMKRFAAALRDGEAEDWERIPLQPAAFVPAALSQMTHDGEQAAALSLVGTLAR